MSTSKNSDDVFELNMFGDVTPDTPNAVTTDTPEEELEVNTRFCGAAGGWDNYVERWHQ